MDEKQIAALREVFEAGWPGRNERAEHDPERYAHPVVDIQWDGFLACYQHLAPMVEDAERYRWLRSDDIEVLPGQREINVYMERLPHIEEPDVLLTESALDEAIDAAREQEEKTC